MNPRENATRGTTRIIQTGALLAWAVIWCWPQVGGAQQVTQPKRVLVLYWYDKDFPFNSTFDKSFRAALQARPQGTVEYYPEYLESNRFPGENQSRVFGDYLRHKYGDRTI